MIQLRTQGMFVNFKNKNASCLFNSLRFVMCPEQDSNLHTVTGTSPSSWRVYQFHHLGVERLKGTKAKRFNGLKTENQQIKKKASVPNRYAIAPLRLCAFLSAQNRTRTCTSSLTLVPETSASTNFAIWAGNYRVQN